MCEITLKVLFPGIILSLIPYSSCTTTSLDKEGCGVTMSCFSIPATCYSSDDCDYLLKYSTNGGNVTFELSSKKYEWVAVGFNKQKEMVPGDSLVCEIRDSKVVLKHYTLEARAIPDASKETNATLLSGIPFGRSMRYCKFTRDVSPGFDKRLDLNDPAYFLYAVGYMGKNKLNQHEKYDLSANPVNLSVITDNSNHSKAVQRIDTSSCGKTMICLRNPSNCANNVDCDYLVTIKKNGTMLEFSVSGKSGGWVAVGFNNKPQMGNTDSVICRQEGNEIIVGTARLKYSRPDPQKSTEISLLDAAFEGGILYCKFSRPIKVQSSQNKMLDLGVPRYIIYGKGLVSGNIKKHEGSGSRGCSNKKVDFGANKIYKLGDCDSEDISKVHGAFMIFAWMFLAIVSIFIARYSRSLWGGKKIVGKDAWFQVHRSIMGIAVLFTVIAIIMIFVAKEGWSETAGDHAVFGIIVLVLAIIQPTIAFFRPHPGSSRRPIFNWIHRIIALGLVVMAVISVFKGADLVEDEGGETVSKILIGLLAVALVTALILEFLAYRIRAQSTQYTAEMSSGKFDVADSAVSDFWEVKAQRVLLAVLFVVIFVLAVVMIAFVAGAGGDHDDDDGDHDDHDH